MHEYFGGTARILVPDDCKNAVVPKALSEKKRAISEAYYEYSCAVKPHIRAGGNRQSGIQETVIASLLA